MKTSSAAPTALKFQFYYSNCFSLARPLRRTYFMKTSSAAPTALKSVLLLNLYLYYTLFRARTQNTAYVLIKNLSVCLGAFVKNMRVYELLKNRTALFKIFELIKTGTRGGQEHDVPVLGLLHSRFYGII